MILRYTHRALHRATYVEMEDGSFAGEVPGLRGVLARGDDLRSCRDQLSEVIEEWVLVRLARGLPVPALDGLTVAVTGLG
jgi:predicted RNase H-like HicB family nuclease